MEPTKIQKYAVKNHVGYQVGTVNANDVPNGMNVLEYYAALSKIPPKIFIDAGYTYVLLD